MATATFDKRIIINQKDADFLVNELENAVTSYPKLEQNFVAENEKEADKWLSNFGKQ